VEEVRALPTHQILYASGAYQVVVAGRSQIPHVMNEIGRLREISFRAAGEGTGKALDIDDFDAWYHQLFVWHAPMGQVLGAYRLCMTDVVRRQRGPDGLYTKSLFRYDESFLDQLGPALELGRSFVRVEYQGAGRVLPLLWRGIAHLLAARPRYRTLFGPVSVSSSYTEHTRQLIAMRLCMGQYRHALCAQVQGLRPLPPCLAHTDVDEDARGLSRRISMLEPDGKGLPILVREYIKLGGQFLAFSLDPDFQNAMDGLVAVDLDRANPRLLSLYMGPENYECFRRSRRRLLHQEMSLPQSA
jgi:putative hemolysin